ARYAAQAASGGLDPLVNWQTSYQHQVTPVSSVLGGSATGSVTQNTFNTAPQLTGFVSRTGATYLAQLSSQRIGSTNQFLSLNPQFRTGLGLSLTQPLLKNLSIDPTRHQIAVATKNETLSAEQFRQQAITIVSEAEQAYWQLAFAARNLRVQIQGLRL